MICIWCGKPITDDQEKASYRSAHEWCRLNLSGGPGLKDRYCSVCGVKMPPIKCKNGRLNNKGGELCSHCMIIERMKKGLEHINKSRKISAAKKLARKPYPEHIRRWRQENPHKVWASQYCRFHKGTLTILYECSCNIPSDQKDRHHPDYSKPLEVMLLCHRCHMKWHSKVKQEAIQTASAVDG